MDFMQAMEIASSSLTANRVRLNLAASNLANAKTTRAADGGPYRRKDPIFRATPLERPFGTMLQDRISSQLRGVQVSGVASDPRPPRTVYDPGHPDADKDGIVKLPNINMIEEMVNMITASRAYEASLSTMQVIKSMANKALTIGR